MSSRSGSGALPPTARSTGRRPLRRDAWVRPVLALLAAAATVTLVTGPAQAATVVPVSGAGSTWASNAIAQWAANVRPLGQAVNYQATGSSDGRKQFANSTVDFAVSEVPWGLTDDGVIDPPPATRSYAYVPLVAGGTALMYNLTIGGRRVTQLRLSGDTVAKIFTGAVTNWSDPLIKADNPLLSLPDRRIVPVVRSDGAGTTEQFTAWLAAKFPATWDAYCATVGRPTPCGATSVYPAAPGKVIAQAGSTGVAGYVAQAANDGTITYVERSYALDADVPVVKLLNKAGYYVEPTWTNVAVGLLGSTINNDQTSPAYLTQQLAGVYDNADARAYPLSSYSYLIVPTSLQGPTTTDKGYSLARFAQYALCDGQQDAAELGYSPLPLNLVTAGFEQLKKIPGAELTGFTPATCHNPTFTADGQNLLPGIAPQPEACAKQGPTQCGVSAPAPASTSTALTALASSTGVTLAATVTPATPGTLTFTEGVTTLKQVSTDASGRATTTLAGVPAGAHAYRATFVPIDPALHSGSTSAIATVVVQAPSTGTCRRPPWYPACHLSHCPPPPRHRAHR